ncbi:MAG: 30S ribosomal protein S9 [Phycisphaera sp.]|nr:30S ribosomal protein S9 [Phycisphaera sp.]
MSDIAIGTDAPAAKPAAQVPSTEPKSGFWWGTGRRKSSVARVRIRPGKGHFLVNGKKVDVYFTELQHQADAHAPLKVTGNEGKFDVYVNANGGGITGQSGAVALGLARALKAYDVANEEALRNNGLLTRDAREVERKKYGQAGARRRFQFSKR